MIDNYVCPIPPNPDKPRRKPCDGSANAYFAHYRRGEPACAESKKAAAFAKRRARRTGLWVGTLPVLDSEDDMYRRLLTPEQWDRWQAKVNMPNNARRPARFEHENFYAEPEAPSD